MESFGNPQLVDDRGNPIAPQLYKKMVHQAYIITKCNHCTYEDVLKMSPLERDYFLEFITEDHEKEEKMIEESRRKRGGRTVSEVGEESWAQEQ